jgi:hypothetical protein
VAQWLIQHAARRAPSWLSARLEEEWLADLESRSSASPRLRFAVGCCWATMVIAADGLPSQVSEPSIASATKRPDRLADRNFAYCSLRSGTLFLIVGLHLALFSGLIMPLSHTHGLAAPSSHRVP